MGHVTVRELPDGEDLGEHIGSPLRVMGHVTTRELPDGEDLGEHIGSPLRVMGLARMGKNF